MIFTDESLFEEAVIENLKRHGWDDEGGVLKHPTEQDLIDNWARIIFENNNTIDRLNGCPLTDSEMSQILEQVRIAATPVGLSGFINGEFVAIKRDNPNDAAHVGKEVALKLFGRMEIAAGQTRYQIAQQPHFTTYEPLIGKKRGDVMLLINGMPVIHIELKRSGVPVTEARNQIEQYLHNGVFTGLFSLVQIFVAMNPEETQYFANPGTGNKVNPKFAFHWADFNNEPINDWKLIVSQLLSIPMAHQMVSCYTVADNSDGCLKVMRSYQYYAAKEISDHVAEIDKNKQWGLPGVRGGFVWHTTGSGKTMTSFKSAQLIAHSKDADKVVFLMDRIELGTQSLAEYKSFADDDECVQGTENTAVLRKRLLEDSYQNTLIVTSIQKMSRIHAEDGGMNAADLEKMRAKRIVFIIDECHRSTFGDMLRTIKETFPDALFFGFTGTPIHEENAKKMSTTSDVFGDELHRYSIADGIRDGNVLGFDPYMVCTFKRSDVRREVALSKAHAQDEDEALSDPQKKGIFYHFLNAVPMAGETDERGTYQRGIEDFVPHSQYAQDEHRRKVIEDMCDGWMSRSNKGMFHGLFATSSIPEAIAYYRLFKEMAPQFKVTALFDPSIDNNGGAAIAKQDGLLEIIKDYNRMYGQNFELATYAAMKADIAARMAHKNTYRDIENKPEKRIDILIVVDQMLTGFDSKWINVLYLDKVIDYALLIQAFSRTNRLFNENLKPFGMIRYYRRPYTMKRNIDQAVKLYSGDRPFALFADKLPANIKMLNALYGQIEEVFKQGGAEGFATLPNEDAHKAKFASLFNEFNEYLNAAKVQGFSWDTLEYRVEDAFDALDASGGVAGAQDGPSLGVAMGASEGESSDEPGVVRVVFDEHAYGALLQRYKELAKPPVPTPPNGDPPQEAPFDLKGYLTEIDTGRIDAAYMNANFEKWLKAVGQPDVSQAELDRLMADLHRSFASLSQEDQRYAELFLDDIQAGDIRVQPGKTFTDYIAMYAADAYNDRVSTVVEALGVDKEMLIHLLTFTITESNINEFGRFDTLLETVDKNRAKAYFEETEGVKCPTYKVNMKVDKLLRAFLVSGGMEW